jgi:phosphate-selective porin OprO/OprP
MDLQRRTRWGAEAHYLWGPFTISYEYNIVEWHDITAYDDKNAFKYELPDTYHVGVHQVWASFFLTGEKKEFQDIFFCWRQPKPKNNFSLKDGTWGAWEILVRGAIRESSSALFDKGVIDGSMRGHSITGGINWIANPKVRVMFNVNYLKNDEGKGIITKSASNGKVDNTTKYVPDELGFILRFVLTI